MGWMDVAVGAARSATDKALVLGRELASAADAELSSRQDYTALKAFGVEVAVAGNELGGGARELAADLTTSIGETRSGAQAGMRLRSTAGYVAQLPFLTLLADAAKARHGVDELYAGLLASPQDPERAVWLAEALDRVGKDMTAYRRVRSATSLTYAARRQLMISALRLGQEPTDSTQVRLLKSAFLRSRSAVRADPENAAALHVLSRVYLAQREADHAERLCKLAILARPGDGLPWITLSRIYLATNRHASAAESARRAVCMGQGFGNEMLAQVVLRTAEHQKISDTATEFDRLRSLITSMDRRAYLGTSVDPREALRNVKDDHLRRAIMVLDGLKGAK